MGKTACSTGGDALAPPDAVPRARGNRRVLRGDTEKRTIGGTAWWVRQDSNLQPDGYEPSALTIELRTPVAEVSGSRLWGKRSGAKDRAGRCV
jgi:hypothetical protein